MRSLKQKISAFLLNPCKENLLTFEEYESLSECEGFDPFGGGNRFSAYSVTSNAIIPIKKTEVK